MSKTAWATLGESTKGLPNGHHPGNPYHDVSATIGRRGARFRVEILEVWGSCQGYDRLDENGRNRVVAIDADLESAVRIANRRAAQANIKTEYMIQALSVAHAEAIDALSYEEEDDA